MLGLVLSVAVVELAMAEFQAPLERIEAERTAAAMREAFDARGYALAQVRETGIAPRIYVHSIPLDLASVPEVHEKKSVFIRTLLPLILKANEEIAEQRARLLGLHGRAPHAPEDAEWLSKLAASYGASAGDTTELLVRVDLVPVSLALAQGIDESGWGTSHFARADEALFGQHAGPTSRSMDEAVANGVAIEAFGDLLDSVRAYLLNLNSGRAYDGLRRHRAELLALGRQPTGLELAAGLKDYSERGNEYVSEIRSIIEVNELHHYDPVKLEPSGGALVIVPER
jgi:Bax protein